MNVGHVILLPLSALILSPLLLGVINRTKALFGGRRGRPLLQAYYDLAKLLRKGAVYSGTTSWVFRAGPIISFSCAAATLFMLPLGGVMAPVSFQGDMLLVAYLLGLMRFFTILAALDTGSAFEGMGASREAQFSVLAELALILGLVALALAGRNAASTDSSGLDSFFSLSASYSRLSLEAWKESGPILLLTFSALLIVFLTENSRIPVDDPNTHLELTMIHEVMVLDHGGPDLGLILYGAAIKMWILGALLAGLLIPVRTGNAWLDGAAAMVGIFILAIITGVVESIMARLRLLRVPLLLVGAGFLSVLALTIVLWR